jgi:hypothetical protein
MPISRPVFVAGSVVLAALQDEATLARFADDDLPRVPEVDCLVSTQSRRPAPVEVH